MTRLQRRNEIELLDLMSTGDVGAAGVLFDRYGPRLFALALMVTDDPAAAERSVRRAFCHPRASPMATSRLGGGARSTWNQLARRTHLACLTNAGLTNERRHRALLALTLHGDHTYHQAADLLEMSPSDAAILLRQILLDASADTLHRE